MTKPARPKVLPTESSVQPPLQCRYEASQRALTRVMRENRVRDECLVIAKTALEHYDRLGLAIPKKALAQINERLAELEPEEETETALDTWESLGHGIIDYPEPCQTYGADE